MNQIKALILISQGQQPDQAMVGSLARAGLVDTDNGTNFDSDGQELHVTSITSRGWTYLEAELKILDDRISALRKKPTPGDPGGAHQEKIDRLINARREVEAALK